MIWLFHNQIINSQDYNKVFVYAGPTITYRKLSENYFDAKPALRYNFGIYYKRSINPKFEIGSGIGYSKMGYCYESPGYQITETIHLKYHRNFLEIPLLFSLNLKEQNKNGILINLNIINQLFISEEVKVKEDGYDSFEYKRKLRDFKDSNFKYYNIAIQLGLCYRRDLNQNLLLSVSPAFKYSLLDMDNIHDWNIGLDIGMGYSF
jgi:hypothetical protein